MKKVILSSLLVSLLGFSACIGSKSSNTSHSGPSAQTPQSQRNPSNPPRAPMLIEGTAGHPYLQLRTLHDHSRLTWVNQGHAAFQNMIHRMQGRDNTAVNKAAIFQRALDHLLIVARGGNRDLQNEQVSIVASDALPSPHLARFSHVFGPHFLYSTDWMNYSEIENFPGFQYTFANFANNRLGGGWNTHGNVQEEQMAQQCPDFALILSQFNPERHESRLHTRKGPDGQEWAKYASVDSAAPLLVTHLRCTLKLHRDYEQNTRRIREHHWDLNNALIEFPDAPSVNMIALAAPELRDTERGATYTLELVRDLFNNAYTAYSLVKKYDTDHGNNTYLQLGRWGAGAFGHNVNMVIAVQYLAARLALGDTDAVRFLGISDADARPGVEVAIRQIDAHFRGDPVAIDSVLTGLWADSVRLNWRTRR